MEPRNKEQDPKEAAYNGKILLKLWTKGSGFKQAASQEDIDFTKAYTLTWMKHRLWLRVFRREKPLYRLIFPISVCSDLFS